MNIKIIQQVISVFENSTTSLQYGYCENIHDGRGYTCGISGWTTANGDAKNILANYPPLERFKNSRSSLMLKIKKFPKLWQGAAHDPQFRALQDKVQYEEYFLPAIELAQRWGITTQIGMLIFCDTNIQHGMESDGPKSPGLASMAGQAQPSGKNFVEKEYLTSFLKIRRKVLMNNGSDWADSLGRVDCLLDLLNASMELKTPFKINPWGDDQPFLITGV